MSNEKVIKAFLEGKVGHTPTRIINGAVYSYKGQTLKTNGLELINYSTRIAYKNDNVLYINTTKYSATTSKIQTQLKRLAENYNYNIVEYRG